MRLPFSVSFPFYLFAVAVIAVVVVVVVVAVVAVVVVAVGVVVVVVVGYLLSKNNTTILVELISVNFTFAD